MTTIKTGEEQALEIKSILDKAYTEMSLLVRTGILDRFKELNHVSEISWTQYTPYFNDGEAAYFSVNAYEMSIDGWSWEEMYTYEEDDDEMGPSARYLCEEMKAEGKTIPNPHFDKEESDKIQELIHFIEVLPPEIMEFCFGDHAEISISSEDTESFTVHTYHRHN